jgi:hypothetical protein
MAYVEDFDGDNAILLSGDSQSLQQLSATLRKLENSTAASLQIHALPFVKAYRGVELTAFSVDEELGVRRTDEVFPHFSWHHSEEGWLEAAELIDGVVSGGGNGHNWLASMAPEDACVLVSLGEYDDDWWRRHFGD